MDGFVAYPPRRYQDHRFYFRDPLAGDVIHAMEMNDKDKFVEAIKRVKSVRSLQSTEEEDEDMEDEDVLVFFWDRMFKWDCHNCVAAIFDGETKGSVLDFVDYKPNGGLPLYAGWSPLHHAAQYASPRITALFLQKGYPADARSYNEHFHLEDALPLNVALANIESILRYRRLWAKRTPVMPVLSLCEPCPRRAVETVRLLVRETKDVEHEFVKYLHGNQTPEVLALLMVAHKHFLPIFQCELKQLSSKHSVKCNRSIDREEDLMEHAHVFCEIFEKVGDQLAAYIQLPISEKDYLSKVHLEVMSIIETTGVLSAKDIDVDDSIVRSNNDEHKLKQWKAARTKVVQRDFPYPSHVNYLFKEEWSRQHQQTEGFIPLLLSKLEDRLAPRSILKQKDAASFTLLKTLVDTLKKPGVIAASLKRVLRFW